MATPVWCIAAVHTELAGCPRCVLGFPIQIYTILHTVRLCTLSVSRPISVWFGAILYTCLSPLAVDSNGEWATFRLTIRNNKPIIVHYKLGNMLFISRCTRARNSPSFRTFRRWRRLRLPRTARARGIAFLSKKRKYSALLLRTVLTPLLVMTSSRNWLKDFSQRHQGI